MKKNYEIPIYKVLFVIQDHFCELPVTDNKKDFELIPKLPGTDFKATWTDFSATWNYEVTWN